MLKRYIFDGKGIGLKWLFLEVVFVLVLSFIGINYFVNKVFETPEMRAFFQKFPEITFQDDKIVSPENTYIRQTVPAVPFSAVILDTVGKQEIRLDFSEGLYLTPTTAYIKMGTDVNYLSYKDMLRGRPLVVTPALIKSFITQVLTLSIGGSFVLFLILSYVIIGFFSYLLLLIFGKRFPLKTCLRASVFASFSLLFLLIVLLNLRVGVSFAWVMVATVILVSYWLSRYYERVKAIQEIDRTLKELNLQRGPEQPEQPEQMEQLDDLPIIQEGIIESVEIHPVAKKNVPAKKSASKKKAQPVRSASKKVPVSSKKAPAKKKKPAKKA